MRTRILRMIFLVISIFTLMHPTFAEKKEYICGIALGFPPYQFSDEKANPIGIDAEITKLLFENTGKKIIFTQEPWDELMAKLYNTNKVDFLCGAEISDERKKMFDFSIPFYKRNIAIFVSNSSGITKLSDLVGLIITGDRHSFVERQLGENKEKFRIMKTTSKEESFSLLKKKKVDAVIAPLEVGNYISKKIGLKIRVIEDNDPGSSIAFMVKKGDTDTLEFINKRLKILIANGEIDKILKKYQ